MASIILNTIKDMKTGIESFKLIDTREENKNTFVVLPMSVLHELRERQDEIFDLMRRGVCQTIISTPEYLIETGVYEEAGVNVIRFHQGGSMISIINVTLSKVLQKPSRLSESGSLKISVAVLNTIKKLEIYEKSFRIIDTRNDKFVELPISVLFELRKREDEIREYIKFNEKLIIMEVECKYRVETDFYDTGDEVVDVIRFWQGEDNMISITPDTFWKIFEHVF